MEVQPIDKLIHFDPEKGVALGSPESNLYLALSMYYESSDSYTHYDKLFEIQAELFTNLDFSYDGKTKIRMNDATVTDVKVISEKVQCYDRIYDLYMASRINVFMEMINEDVFSDFEITEMNPLGKILLEEVVDLKISPYESEGWLTLDFIKKK